MIFIILSDFYIIVKGSVKYMPKRILYKNTILNGFKILEDLPSEKGKSKSKSNLSNMRKRIYWVS